MATPGEPVPQADLGPSTSTRRFPFAFAGVPGLACRPFLVTPATAWVTVSLHEVEARYGPWRTSTPIDNIVEVCETGPYRWPFVAGPPRLSGVDHGVTFATTDAAGVCLLFREPLPPVVPLPRWRHPGLTVTVADPAGFAALVRQRAGLDPAAGRR